MKPKIAEGVASGLANGFEQRLSKVARTTPVEALYQRVLKFHRSKAYRQRLRKRLERQAALLDLPQTARSEQPESALAYYERMSDFVAAWKLAGAGVGTEFPHLVDVARKLASNPNPAVRAITSTFDPSLLKSARSMLEAEAGKVRLIDADEFDGILAVLAGRSAECDLFALQGWPDVVQAVKADFAAGNGIPKEFANVAFDLEPIVARNVRTPGLEGAQGKAYVDVQVGFAGYAPADPEPFFLGAMRTQSKLDNVAGLFAPVDDLELFGQLLKDDLRWNTGALDLNGARFRRDHIGQTVGGQRIVTVASRDVTDAELALAREWDIHPIPLRHRFGAGAYFTTAREIMGAFGIRRRSKKKK